MRFFAFALCISCVLSAQSVLSQETSQGDAKESSFQFKGLRLNNPVSYKFRLESQNRRCAKGNDEEDKTRAIGIAIENVRVEWREYESLDRKDEKTGKSDASRYTHILAISCSGIEPYERGFKRLERQLLERKRAVDISVDYRFSALIGPSEINIGPTLVEGKPTDKHSKSFRRLNGSLVATLASALPSSEELIIERDEFWKPWLVADALASYEFKLTDIEKQDNQMIGLLQGRRTKQLLISPKDYVRYECRMYQDGSLDHVTIEIVHHIGDMRMSRVVALTRKNDS